MLGLIEATEKAQEIEDRINGWPIDRRKRATGDHEKLLAKTLHRYNLETQCTKCYAVMDTAINPVRCNKCGSSDTVSPYYA